MPSLIYCILISHVDKGRIKYLRDLQKQESSKFVLTLTYWGVLQGLIFLGRTIWSVKVPRKVAFFAWIATSAKILQWIIFWLLTDVTCARIVRNQLSTFFFTVQWREIFCHLGYHVLCQERWFSCVVRKGAFIIINIREVYMTSQLI